MLSFHFVNDVSNDFRRKVLKPSLPHAIAVETLPKVLQGYVELFFFSGRRIAFVYIELLSRREYSGCYLDMTLLFSF